MASNAPLARLLPCLEGQYSGNASLMANFAFVLVCVFVREGRRPFHIQGYVRIPEALVGNLRTSQYRDCGIYCVEDSSKGSHRGMAGAGRREGQCRALPA